LYLHGGYQRAFAVLLISAALCLTTLIVAWVIYRRPHEMEERSPQFLRSEGFSKTYWMYVWAGTLIAAGFADFSLIAFHFQKAATVSQGLVPVFYAVAMAMGALASLIFGRLFDKLGQPVLLLAFFLSAFFAPFVFLGGPALALAGMMLWGIGMGTQDSLLKAVLTDTLPPEKRSTGFGVFDTGFGIAWFAGSAAMGLLYDRSILGLILFSVVLQLAALPLLSFAKRHERR
jgi:predicted MFS family arabinose efflux permease